MKVVGLRLLTMISTAGSPAIAFAQDAAAPAGNASSAQIGDIVVTAQRRAESAQDVPISLQSFSADARVYRPFGQSTPATISSCPSG